MRGWEGRGKRKVYTRFEGMGGGGEWVKGRSIQCLRGWEGGGRVGKRKVCTEFEGMGGCG